MQVYLTIQGQGSELGVATVHAFGTPWILKDLRRRFRDPHCNSGPLMEQAISAPALLTLVLVGGGGGVDFTQLFKELFSQPKLDIFRGV